MLVAVWPLLLAFSSAKSIFGPVYETGGSHAFSVIPLSSDVRDGRICKVTDVFDNFDAADCDFSLPDIKLIDSTEQKEIITMCFGLYDVFYEICRLPKNDEQMATYFDNSTHREPQKIQEFCVEAEATRFANIFHKDLFLDKWAEYAKKLISYKNSCTALCQSGSGVHYICKLIIAGHRYLGVSDGTMDKHNMSTAKPLSIHAPDDKIIAINDVQNASKGVLAEVISTPVSTGTMDKHDMFTAKPLSIHAPDDKIIAINDVQNASKGVLAEVISTPDSTDFASEKNFVEQHGARHPVREVGGSSFSIWLVVVTVIIFFTMIALVFHFTKEKMQRISRALLFRRRRSRPLAQLI